jgi:TatD DNase family protein
VIDSHCHFDLPDFDGDRSQVIANCKALGVDRLLVPGLSLSQFKTLLAMKSQYNVVDIALGWHPYYLEELKLAELSQHMSELALAAKQNSKNIVAIGECGLDGSLPLSMTYQERVLHYQIQIAKDIGKPLILHHRQSHNQLIRLLKIEKFDLGGVIHAFSGSEQIAKTYIDLGFVLGVGGTITYQRAVKTRATIANIELKHLLLETDAPDMPVFAHQGKRNSPEKLPLIAQALAELHGCNVSDVDTQTTNNYHRVFKQSETA